VLGQGLVAERPPKPGVQNRHSHLTKALEALYAKFNRREFVHPDPLEFLYDFPDKAEREVVGLICAALAYGRVEQILKSISICLKKMEMKPRAFLETHSPNQIKAAFSDFGYRFTKGAEMAAFLTGLKAILERYGSIEAAFASAPDSSGTNGPASNTIQKLSWFVTKVLELSGLEKSYLLPHPQKKSACKRLFLYLRWMVRSDDVDPGGWTCILPKDLIIPLDTHMFNISKQLGLTTRKQANLKTALEITEAFRQLSPDDPVKYDFVLTRFGIRRELSRNNIPGLISTN